MAADITGSDKIQEFIRKSGRDSFAIMRPGQSLQNPSIFEFEGNNAQDAAEQFGQWAELCDQDGQNTSRYDLNLYSKGTNYDDLTATQKKDKKFKSKLVLTFQLNGYSSGQRPAKDGQPVNVQVAAPREREPDMSGYMRREDVAALLEKVQTNHEIQRLSSVVAALSRKLEERELEDEEYFDEEEEEEEEPEPKEDDVEKFKQIGKIANQVIDKGTEAYLKIKGNKAPAVLKATQGVLKAS